MAKRLTARQRAFLRHYIAAGLEDQGAAYLKAGFRAQYPSQAAAHCLKLQHVAAELERLQAVMSKVAGDDAKRIMDELQATLTFARTNNDTNNRLRAIDIWAKLTGQYVEKHEDVSRNAGEPSEIAAKLAATVITAILPILTRYQVPQTEVQQALAGAFGQLEQAKPTAH